jgi:formate hydrogenlyase subunit 3/multisubunit Na+/H+ antiporter MnhD subunit
MLISKVSSTLRLMQLLLCNIILWFIITLSPYAYTLFDDQFLINSDIAYKSCLICYLFYLINSTKGANNYSHLQVITILIGLLFLLQSQDLLITFVCFELINISLYLLICTYSSGIKYILSSLILTTFFIFGIVLVYANHGHTNIGEINFPLLLVF